MRIVLSVLALLAATAGTPLLAHEGHGTPKGASCSGHGKCCAAKKAAAAKAASRPQARPATAAR